MDNNDIQSLFVNLDTDYTPILDKYKDIKINDEEQHFILVEVPVVDDVYIAALKDNKENKDMINETKLRVVGDIYSKINLDDLLYGLNHPSRASFKAICTDIKKSIDTEFKDADDTLRNSFSYIK